MVLGVLNSYSGNVRYWADWSKFNINWELLEHCLNPLRMILIYYLNGWDPVERVFSNSAYQGKPDRKWWSNVMTYPKAYGSGQIMHGQQEFQRILTQFLEGTKNTCSISEMSAGLGSVPLTLHYSRRGVIQGNCHIFGRNVGFYFTRRYRLSVQPFQGRALFL